MYTVYGIYYVGSNEVLYIGSTGTSLKERFDLHVNSSLMREKKLNGAPLTDRASDKKVAAFLEHVRGGRQLVIMIIAQYEDRYHAVDYEYIKIRAHKPPFNTRTKDEQRRPIGYVSPFTEAQ